MKHDVILFVPVKVKFVGIEADSHIDAIKAAEKALVIERLIPTKHGPFKAFGDVEDRTIDYVEPEDEATRALVDEAGDEEYERSQYYMSKPDGTWIPEPAEAGVEPRPDPYAQWRTDCPSCGHAVLIVESVILCATGKSHHPGSVLQADGFCVNCNDELKDQSTSDEVIKCDGCGKRFDLSALALA